MERRDFIKAFYDIGFEVNNGWIKYEALELGIKTKRTMMEVFNCENIFLGPNAIEIFAQGLGNGKMSLSFSVDNVEDVYESNGCAVICIK